MSAAPGRVLFVASHDEAPPARDDTLVLVSDTSWTPSPMGRPDVRPLRPVISRIVEGTDLFGDALGRLDEWAATSGLTQRSINDGIAIWHQIREGVWTWLHERFLWAFIMSEVVGPETVVEVARRVEEAALVDVLEAHAARGRRTILAAEHASAAPGPAPGSAPARSLRRIVRSIRDRSLPGSTPGSLSGGRRADPFDDRIARVAAHRGRGVLVLSYLRVAQVIGSGDGARTGDPNLAVIGRLVDAGLEPIVLALGADRRDAAGAAAIEGDERVLPDRLLSTRWANTNDPIQGADATSPAADAVDAAIADAPSTALEVAGVDLGPALRAEIRRRAREAVVTNQRVIARVGRMLDELRPAAVVLTHEGLRTAWLAAADRRGIPTFAIQHGVIYPTHPGYRHAREPGLMLPTRTFVYGDYERRTLLAHGGYRDDEVAVSGAPRLDLDTTSTGAQAAAERDAVRHELGVADGDRLLVVSTVNVAFILRSHYLHMFDRILGAPLPGVHVVFKQHPGERDEGPYRDLLVGIARAAGFDPPPISVVKDIDLYRLLRAADAHLGLFSTVLTDAVVAGTPNLFADVIAHGDVLGYVAVGVATPVRTPTELLDALADARPPDPVARQAFLRDHFRSGDASARIAADVARAVGVTTG